MCLVVGSLLSCYQILVQLLTIFIVLRARIMQVMVATTLGYFCTAREIEVSLENQQQSEGQNIRDHVDFRNKLAAMADVYIKVKRFNQCCHSVVTKKY